MSEHSVSYGYIHLRESHFDKMKSLPELDVFIFCHSWEQRSIDLLKNVEPSTRLVAISFENSFAINYQDVDANARITSAASAGTLAEIALETSLKVHSNCVRLHKELVPLISQRGLRVGIDISSIPKVYTLSIIGWIFNERVLPSVKLFYSEGVYEHSLEGGEGDISNVKLARFTSSPWTITPIPYLEGGMFTEAGCKLLAFCGGDHQDILEVLATYEHLDRRAIITSSDPTHPDPIALRHAKSFVEMAGIVPDLIQFANPNSAVDALIRGREMMQPKGGHEPDRGLILPFSTKAHAVAAAVISLFDTSITVLARCPAAYMTPQIRSSGKGTIMTLADLSSPIVAEFL